MSSASEAAPPPFTPGRFAGRTAVAGVDDATWERVFAVNLTAPMRLTRAVPPLMLAAGGGAIVNGWSAI
jgi:NAD(P)-dependent dehydrogenase (short-subunit alcohol dehydrogenase family)